MRRTTFIPAIVLVFLCVSTASWGVALKIKPASVRIDMGKITQSDKEDVYEISIHPEFHTGALTTIFGIGAYVNQDLSTGGRGKSAFVVDSAEYRNRRLFARFGEIEGLTLGRGFIVNDFRSDVTNNLPSMRTKGTQLSIKSPRSDFKVFNTNTLAGGRAARTMGHVTLGATYVHDNSPNLSIVGVDADYLVEEPISFYAQAAQISDLGIGWAMGMTLEPAKHVGIMAEFRQFDSDFAPGIIDSQYEASNIVSTLSGKQGSVGGYLVGATFFKDTNHAAHVTYEDYENTAPRIALTGSYTLNSRVDGEIYYAQENFVPSRSLVRDNSVVRFRLRWLAMQHVRLVFDLYDAFDKYKNPLRSYELKAQIKM